MKALLLALIVLTTMVQTSFAQTVTVMSWNIRLNTPRDGVNAWPNRKDWLARIVADNQTDIAGFQEVLAGQLEDLKERLKDMDAYGVGRDDGKAAGEFSPIFYRRDRFELQEKSTFWLSSTPDEVGSKGWDAALPRIASWVKLKDRQSGKQFYVLNTHFDHRGVQARAESAALIVKYVRAKFADHPVILTGDFNTTPDSEPYRTITGAGIEGRSVFRDTYAHSAQKPEGPDSTWNGFTAIVPGQRIDFVFTTESVKTLRTRILDDQKEGRFPSDHLPVVAELRLGAE